MNNLVLFPGKNYSPFFTSFFCDDLSHFMCGYFHFAFELASLNNVGLFKRDGISTPMAIITVTSVVSI